MHIVHLSLTSFRNYTQLEFEFPPEISVFQGANAQGKSNLLESIYLLATTRLSRSVPDRELINWIDAREKMAFARVAAEIQRDTRSIQLDIFLQPRSTTHYETGATFPPIQKYIRVNGIARRAVDLMGQLNMVMFSPRDIDLIDGEPSLRRRHIDITNSQVNPQYLRSLQRYNRIVSQRNRLLRQIALGQSRVDELAFWDQEMVKSGSYIVFQRQQALGKLNELASPIHDQLSGGKENLNIHYHRSIDSGVAEFDDLGDVEQIFNEALSAARERDLARGVSSIGPHRDDLKFIVNEVDMGSYGSRGQQRTVALSLKLAEAKFMLTQTGEAPVLLLDDVLSELDMERRQHLLQTVSDYQQVLMTTTDLDRFPSDFLSRAEKFTVENGTITKSPF